MKHHLVPALLGVSLIASASSALAFGNRVGQIPNNIWGCGGCHTNGGGTPRHSFGQDVERTVSGGNVDWSAVCPLDSDGDGYSNGAELGDPECVWRIGSPNPAAAPTRPYDDSDYPRVPMGGEPVGGEPVAGGMGGGPVGGEPVGGEPVAGEPVGGGPVGGEPVGGEPVAGEPVGGGPVAGEPVGGGPVAGAPEGGEAEPPVGMGGAPAGGAPVTPPNTDGTPEGSVGAAVEDEGCAARPGRAPWLLLALLLLAFRRRVA